MNRTILLAAVPLALLGACSKGAAPAADPAKVLEAIDIAEQTQIAAIGKKDLAGAASIYTADATLFAPGAQPVKGTAAIQAYFGESLKDPAFDVKPAEGTNFSWVAASGDLAVTGFTGTLTQTDPATKKAASKPFVSQMVWKKQADGSWKIVSDFNAVMPAAPTPAAK